MKRISTLGLTVALMLGGVAAQAVELMHWERLPLAVPLLINQERVIFVDEENQRARKQNRSSSRRTGNSGRYC